MASRLELRKKLEDILGTRHVYFQPPETIKLKYPAIIYQLARIDKKSADDAGYLYHRNYNVTLIDKNPDSEYVMKIAQLPKCRFDRFYTVDHLNHYVFSLYF